MTPEQVKAILEAMEECEAWMGGLLDKFTKTKKLIQQAGAVSTAPKNQQSVLTTQQLAEISAKRKARMYKQ